MRLRHNIHTKPKTPMITKAVAVACRSPEVPNSVVHENRIGENSPMNASICIEWLAPERRGDKKIPAHWARTLNPHGLRSSATAVASTQDRFLRRRRN